MANVELERVSKVWPAARSAVGAPTLAAVDDVSFRAERGQLVALLGPSGCGKSTTLRMIAGLDEPTYGVIRIEGRDVTHVAPAKRGVSMVFQSYALFPHLTVAENIVFGLRVRKVETKERERRLKRATEVLGLAGLLERRPSQLSGGQQQRVALGRAIVAETPVCLMDEPLSNLDAQLRGEMRREIRDLQQRLGITMLYVTHDQVEAMTMADKIVLMNKGRVEQMGSPHELYETPATMFAARFVGTPPMNLIGAAALASAAPDLMSLTPKGRRADDLTCGIRPENLVVAPSSAAGSIEATIKAIEYLGADSLIEANVAGTRVVARAGGRIDRGIGDGVSLRAESIHLHWFDTSSGRRIGAQ